MSRDHSRGSMFDSRMPASPRGFLLLGGIARLRRSPRTEYDSCVCCEEMGVLPSTDLEALERIAVSGKWIE